MDTTAYQIDSSIAGDSEEDTALLRSMALEARKYLTGFDWCPPIKALYLAAGIGGVVAVFLAELTKKINDQDDCLWVIVGDLPSAYLVTDDIPTPKVAIESYCDIMDGWVEAVRSGSDVKDAFPVANQPTQKNAEHLASRLRFLRERIVPTLA